MLDKIGLLVFSGSSENPCFKFDKGNSVEKQRRKTTGPKPTGQDSRVAECEPANKALAAEWPGLFKWRLP
jgi:hypothetical protein